MNKLRFIDMKKIVLGIMMLCWMGAKAQTYNYDVNGDGAENMEDVSCLINHLLGKLNKGEHGYVDLGLSVKWATCNVGAENPADYGLYFAWGETTGYASDTSDGRSFDWESYKWMTSGASSWKGCTKYTFADGETLGCWYSDGTYVGTTVDGVTYKDLKELDSSDDAATVNWGGAWRMPTSEEQYELINNCYWEFTTSYNNTGVAGFIIYRVKSDSDKGLKRCNGSSTTAVGSYSLSDTHIFLPAAGNRSDSYIYRADSNGRYWSGTLSHIESENAVHLSFDSSNLGNVSTSVNYRYFGLSVRPVCP